MRRDGSCLTANRLPQLTTGVARRHFTVPMPVFFRGNDIDQIETLEPAQGNGGAIAPPAFSIYPASDFGLLYKRKNDAMNKFLLLLLGDDKLRPGAAASRSHSPVRIGIWRENAQTDEF